MYEFPRHVQINEEGPREGFQIEAGPIPTVRKVELIDALSETGLSQIQVVSFVNPKRVPGMADADEVIQGFRRREGVRYTGLWLNKTGFLRALESKKLDLAGSISLTASEVFLSKNQGRTIEQNIQAQHEMVRLFVENGVSVRRGSVMSAFGCNYQGVISVQDVLRQVQIIMEIASAHDQRIETVSLADTMGWATPDAIHRVVGAVREKYPDLSIALHLHDTRGMGIANAYAGLQMGVSIFDSAVAGLGGCPFAANKGAAGNVCTEDLVFMLHEMGIETGVDLDRLIQAAQLAEEIVGHPLPGKVKTGGALDVLRARALQ